MKVPNWRGRQLTKGDHNKRIHRTSATCYLAEFSAHVRSDNRALSNSEPGGSDRVLGLHKEAEVGADIMSVSLQWQISNIGDSVALISCFKPATPAQFLIYSSDSTVVRSWRQMKAALLEKQWFSVLESPLSLPLPPLLRRARTIGYLQRACY